MTGSGGFWSRCWRVSRWGLFVLRFVATGVSGVLLLAVLTAWARGYWVGDMVQVTRRVNAEGFAREQMCLGFQGGGEVGMLFGTKDKDLSHFLLPPETGWQWEHTTPNASMTPVSRQIANLGPALKTVPGCWVVERWGIVAAGAELDFDGRMKAYFVAFPCWMLAAALALLPAQRTYALVRRRAKRRQDLKGMCVQCGYDLRATPDPDGPRLPRCPECGRETEAGHK